MLVLDLQHIQQYSLQEECKGHCIWPVTVVMRVSQQFGLSLLSWSENLRVWLGFDELRRREQYNDV